MTRENNNQVDDEDITAFHDAVQGLATQVGTFNTRLKFIRLIVDVLAVVMVIVVVGAGVVVWLTIHVDNVTACQERQNAAFRNVSIQSRAAVTREDTQQIISIDQQLAVLTTAADPNSTLEQRRNAILKDVTALRAEREAIVAAQQTRTAHPIPTEDCS